MRIEKISISSDSNFDGPFVIVPDVFSDFRGFFYESWNQEKFESLLQLSSKKNIRKKISFVQDNHSSSSKGVLRGLHFQTDPAAQSKLIRCIKGKIFDVFVDIRKSSATFKKWGSCIISAENKKQIWIPEGFAHGFLSLEENTEINYKTTNYWNKRHEKSIAWNDPDLGIQWPSLNTKFKLSEKDAEAPLLKHISREKLFK